MRAFGWFLAAVGGTLLLAAGLAWPLYSLLHPIAPDLAFHKIAGRLWQVTMIAGVALCVWRLRLRGRADWGWDLPRPDFLRQAGIALAAGLATMLPMSLAMLGLGIRSLRPELDAAMVVDALLTGLVTGLAVGLAEETFFRGLMFSAVRRESGVRVAIATTALLYASIHFLARTKIPHSEVGPDSGFVLLASTLRWFGDPGSMADAFATLFLVGVLLALVRHWTGAIAGCIGLHMGWVWMIKFTVATTRGQPEEPLYWLVSRFDGFTGWMVACWCAAIIAVVWASRASLERFRRA